jgi:hypothetical protein
MAFEKPRKQWNFGVKEDADAVRVEILMSID